MNDRRARAALARLGEPGDPRLTGLVADLGAEQVYDQLRNARDVGGLLSDVALRLRGLDPERDLAEAASRGIRFLVPGDAEWPASLMTLDEAEPVQRRGGAPLGLWVRGPARLDEAALRSVAVVGSRSATSYGAQVAYDLGADVARDGVTVVSGAAFGIDQASHRGCLAVGGTTIAVLACGVDRAYPSAHRQLLDYISDTGVVVSELAPGCSPTKLRFLARNRIIAGLSLGTVVVEAAVRSGALSTANWTARLHRPVMGVPGPVTSAPSAGVHELIRDAKAALVTCGRDVMELISASGSMLTEVPRGETRRHDRLDEPQLRVLEALPVVHGVSAESIARTAGLSLATTVDGLNALEGQGAAERVEGVWRLSSSARIPPGNPPDP